MQLDAQAQSATVHETYPLRITLAQFPGEEKHLKSTTPTITGMYYQSLVNQCKFFLCQTRVASCCVYQRI